MDFAYPVICSIETISEFKFSGLECCGMPVKVDSKYLPHSIKATYTCVVSATHHNVFIALPASLVSPGQLYNSKIPYPPETNEPPIPKHTNPPIPSSGSLRPLSSLEQL